MVCEANETDVDIGIPAVMLPQDAGENLKNHILNNSVGMFHYLCECVYFFVISHGFHLSAKFGITTLYFDSLYNYSLLFCMYVHSQVSVQLYSPLRPLVDVAEVFLWLMAVGTILCASYWSAWTARESAIEQEKLLKVTGFFSSQFYEFFLIQDKYYW